MTDIHLGHAIYWAPQSFLAPHRSFKEEVDIAALDLFGLSGYFNRIRSRVIGAGSELENPGSSMSHATPIKGERLEEAKNSRGFQHLAAHLKDRANCEIKLQPAGDGVQTYPYVRLEITKLGM